MTQYHESRSALWVEVRWGCIAWREVKVGRSVGLFLLDLERGVILWAVPQYMYRISLFASFLAHANAFVTLNIQLTAVEREMVLL